MIHQSTGHLVVREVHSLGINTTVPVCVTVAVLMLAGAVAMPMLPSMLADESSGTDPIHYDEKMDAYYSESFFYGPATTFNPQLATLSMNMANHSIVLKDKTGKYDDEWYRNQPNRLSEFLTAIGFDSFDCNEDYRKITGFNTIGIGVAKKTMSVGDKEYTLIAMAPRSGGYYYEWSNNVWIGTGKDSDSMHEGWYNAANKAVAFVKQYIQDKEISGDVKIWTAGFSRGGATCNIFSALVDNSIDQGTHILGDSISLKNEDVYTYTFESPQGANINSTTVKPPKDEIYSNIWNIIEPNDLVPKVAMSGWGFTRFGTDVFITTQFFDAWNFEENRNILSCFYGMDSIKSSDKLEMWGVPGGAELSVYLSIANLAVHLLSPSFVFSITTVGAAANLYSAATNAMERDNRKSGYDGNIVEMLFLEELTKQLSRDEYCDEYQSDISDVMMILTGYTSERKDAVTSNLLATGIMGGVISLVLNGGTGILSMFIKNLFASDDVKKIEDTALSLYPVLKDIFDERPSETVSLALNISNIFENHNSDLILAHMMAQDSLYIDAYNDDPDHKTKIRTVPLRDNADLARARFDTYNQVKLYLESKADKNLKVYMEGFSWGLSKIHRCERGFAVGYYSYGTGEKMELFFHVDDKFVIEYESFSKKFWDHNVTYDLYYHYDSLGADGVAEAKLYHNSYQVSWGAGPDTHNPGKTAREMLE